MADYKDWVPGHGSFSGFVSDEDNGGLVNWVPGTGSYSGFRQAPGQATAPGAPTNVTAVGGNASALVSWDAPADGGSPILYYTVTSDPATTPQQIDSGGAFEGLTNGVEYTFIVVATNAVGDGPASDPSNAVTPATVPGAPTGVTAVAGNASATVSWTPPVDDGGSAIVLYTVFSDPSVGSGVVMDSGDSFPGLTNGTAYTFTVVATNIVGGGPASDPSNSVTPSTVPAAPTIGTATAGDTTAVVTWTDNGTGGSAITSHNIISNPATTTQHFSSGGTFTGLTNGVAYTFTVQAVNANGASASSSASNSVTPTPALPANTRIRDTTMTNWVQTASTTVTQDFTAPDGSNGYTLTNVTTSGADYHTIFDNVAGGYSDPSGLSGNAKNYYIAAKKGTINFISLGFYNGGTAAGASFDLNTGATGVKTGTGITSTITALGGGWYLCKMTCSTNHTTPMFVGCGDTAQHALDAASYPVGSVNSFAGTVLVYHPAATA